MNPGEEQVTRYGTIASDFKRRYQIVIDTSRRIERICVGKQGIFIDYSNMNLTDETSILGTNWSQAKYQVLPRYQCEPLPTNLPVSQKELLQWLCQAQLTQGAGELRYPIQSADGLDCHDIPEGMEIIGV